MAKSFSQIKQRSTYRQFNVLDSLGIPHGTALPTSNTETSRASIFVLTDASDATLDKIYSYDTVVGQWNPITGTGAGVDGKSAYEIAVINGFSGTQTAWLASLKGADGKSAYQTWLDAGNTGDVNVFLLSLKGANGVGIPSGGALSQVLAKRTSDNFETEWVDQTAASAETAATIKTKYESNADTNAYTDAEKTKVANTSGTNTGDQDLSGKVDKVTGMGLSSNDYTTGEKTKLAGLESSKYKGLYANKAALDAANVGGEGNYADVDAGTGADVARWIWDTSDTKWVLQEGTSTAETAASIKTKYESNADTNAYTDAEKTKLSGLNNYDDTALTTSVANKVDKNTAITAGTKTKITYDTKGLVTNGADATQDDIGDGTTYKQYSATEKTKLASIADGAQVNDANTTLQGNTFNGASQLVKTDGTGKLPAIDGSQLTGISAGGASINDTTASTTTVYSSSKTQSEIDTLSAEIASILPAGNALFLYYNFT